MGGTIAMLTDFGTSDNYVGMMKAVIGSIAPDTRIIDISHNIAPQHVREGAFALLNAHTYFPTGTVFLVVIDPGVGTTRTPIAAQAGDYTFVAPDNGVLSYALSQFDSYHVISLTDTDYHRQPVSHTFHGRDIFAPVAAHISAGIAIETIGEPQSGIMQLPRPYLSIEENTIIGEVIHIDHFGNIISSIGTIRWNAEDRLTLTPIFDANNPPVRILADETSIQAGQHTINRLHLTYGEVPRGELVALVGSNGFLEIAVNQGSASERLDVRIGDRIQLHIGEIDATVRY